MAPEMVCLESLQEWVQARKTVRRTADVTNGGLKLVHAFYISMLGIRYRTSTGYRVLWPSQYTWLLNKGLISWDDRDSWGLSEDYIKDKSKADGLVKLAALCQVFWFVLQCVTRSAHSLPIAPLEAMTLAYVFIVLLTYGFWWYKPKDIATVTFVDLPDMTSNQATVFESLAMENTYDVDFQGPDPPKNIAWYLIARDCNDDELLVMGAQEGLENNGIDTKIPESIHSVTIGEDGEAGEGQITKLDRKNRIGTWPLYQRSRNPEPRSEIHIASTWGPVKINGHIGERLDVHKGPAPRARENNTVPRNGPEHDPNIITEWDEALYFSKLWPLICILGAAFGALHLISWKSVFPTMLERWLWRSSALCSVATSIICMQFRTLSLQWKGPLTIVQIGSPILYGLSRVVMMAEVFASLRAMAPAIYETYEIWNYWLHFL